MIALSRAHLLIESIDSKSERGACSEHHVSNLKRIHLTGREERGDHLSDMSGAALGVSHAFTAYHHTLAGGEEEDGDTRKA